MATVREFIIERMQQYDETFDVTDPVFVAEVLNPVSRRYGDDLPTTDPQELIRARMEADAPDLDATVFADTFGKPAASLQLPMWTELRASLSRRQLDDETVLTQTDLADQRDVYFVDPTEGSFSQGSIRVYYTSPRAVLIDPTLLIKIPSRTGKPSRTYRPAAPVQKTLVEVRAAREGTLYFVDVPIIATAAGAEYDLEPGEALGATGFQGAVRTNNSLRVTGGGAKDDISSLLARIRASVRFRGFATPGAAEAIIPTLDIPEFLVVQGGNSLMLRDRLYGPASISGIPGGFTAEADIIKEADPDNPEVIPFVSLGIAFDVWVRPSDQARRATTRVSVLQDRGVETMVGGDGRLEADITLAVGAQYVLTTQSFRFAEVVGTEGLFPAYPGKLRPVQVGDWVEFEGQYNNSIAGDRRTFVVRNVISGNELRLGRLDDEDPLVSEGFPGSHFRVLRPLSAQLRTDDLAERYPVLSVPLTDPRAYSLTGAELFSEGRPALVKHGTTVAEAQPSGYIPQRVNYLNSTAALPITSVDRLELLDAITQQSSGSYLYPHYPLYAELLQSKSALSVNKAVLLRVHVLGPQATACPDSMEVTDGTEDLKLFPLSWTHLNVTAVGDGPDTDILQISDSFSELKTATVTITGRVPRQGDWAHFYTAPDDVAYILPILSVSTIGEVQVAAPDIPSGLIGTLRIYQGASRNTLLAEGRGPEGTYSFDVWLQESTEVGYVPGDPPVYGTTAFMDVAKLLSQGFSMVSPLPAETFSPKERSSLVLHGGYANDSEQLSGRSIQAHASSGATVNRVQDLIDSPDQANRPQCMSGLARVFSPSYVVFSVFFDAENLSAEAAGKAAASVFDGANREDRIEASDVIGAVRRAGADYAVTGRIFVLQQNHVRDWTYVATRTAFPVSPTGRFILHAIQVVRLRRRATGEVFDEQDSENWVDTAVYRAGDFRED